MSNDEWVKPKKRRKVKKLYMPKISMDDDQHRASPEVKKALHNLILNGPMVGAPHVKNHNS